MAGGGAPPIGMKGTEFHQIWSTEGLKSIIKLYSPQATPPAPIISGTTTPSIDVVVVVG